MKLGTLLKEAFDEAGIPFPEKKEHPRSRRNSNKSSEQNRTHQKKTSKTHDQETVNTKKNKPKSVTSKNKTYRRSDGKVRRIKPFREPEEKGNVSYTKGGVKIVRSQAIIKESPKASIQKNQNILSEFKEISAPNTPPEIIVHPNASLIWGSKIDEDSKLYNWKQSGKNIELGITNQIKRLFLGLDFGTSTLKAVIHDKERKHSYAVPFSNYSGIRGYLLPCHIYINEGKYSLDRGDILSQDLKLAFLANPENKQAQHHVIAFLALALQQIRSWLLSEHGDTYSGSIIWYMTMGLPATHSQEQALVKVFENIGTAAWIASTNNAVTPEAVEESIARAQQLSTGSEPEIHEDIVVDVEPEITAQIYGLVSSTAYNPSARNFYLMVDIGAGTLDASIFHIKRRERKHNEADFSIFRTTIKPHGVMNWHSERIRWLLSELSNNSSLNNNLINSLFEIHRITDSTEPLPARISDYFEGIEINLNGSECPDDKFYYNVNKQVAADTYLYVEQNKLIARNEMTAMPMFLCGGGSRLPMYQKLIKDMSFAQNARWFGTKIRALSIPENLLAPGLIRSDYDRLSVAYGLSQMKSGKVNYTVPPLEGISSTDYQNRYINKDLL